MYCKPTGTRIQESMLLNLSHSLPTCKLGREKVAKAKRRREARREEERTGEKATRQENGVKVSKIEPHPKDGPNTEDPQNFGP